MTSPCKEDLGTKIYQKISLFRSFVKIISVIYSGTNTALHEFLHARNPKNQHSGTLESYLIKPIQVNNVIIIFHCVLLYVLSCQMIMRLIFAQT